MLQREPQAVELRRVLTCEWAFEGKPNPLVAVGFDGTLPLPSGAYDGMRKSGNSCFNQGGTANSFVPIDPKGL